MIEMIRTLVSLVQVDSNLSQEDPMSSGSLQESNPSHSLSLLSCSSCFQLLPSCSQSLLSCFQSILSCSQSIPHCTQSLLTTYINIFVIFYNYCRFLNMISGLWKNWSRLIKTSPQIAHRLIKTGLYQSGPVIGIFGLVLDQSQSQLSPIWVQKPDWTRL